MIAGRAGTPWNRLWCFQVKPTIQNAWNDINSYMIEDTAIITFLNLLCEHVLDSDLKTRASRARTEKQPNNFDRCTSIGCITWCMCFQVLRPIKRTSRSVHRITHRVGDATVGAIFVRGSSEHMNAMVWSPGAPGKTINKVSGLKILATVDTCLYHSPRY